MASQVLIEVIGDISDPFEVHTSALKSLAESRVRQPMRFRPSA